MGQKNKKDIGKELVLWVKEVHLKQHQRLQVLMSLMFIYLQTFFWHVNVSLPKKSPRQKKQNYYKVISINKDRSATSFKFICI